MKIKDYVAKYDSQNQFDVLLNSYKQIDYAWNNRITIDRKLFQDYNKIIVSGLGGSAIAGDLLQNFLGDELKIPYMVNRNYNLPPFADKNTLVIISSYSGNTEETVSVYEQALKAGCQIIVITTGGKVEELSQNRNIPIVKLQKGFHPRFALGMSFFSLLRIFSELGIIASPEKDVMNIKDIWEKRGVEYSGEDNIAFKYAEELNGFLPVIYSNADVTSAVGNRWKGQFNENSKLHAFANVIPELNHNEIVAWETFNGRQFNAKLINILDDNYLPQIKKRFTITSELASNNNIEILNISSDLADFKTRLMDLIYLGDWISYYLAVIRGYDPAEIKNINILKERLS
jgi:glucose/mannose-6-phosphate isomerase